MGEGGVGVGVVGVYARGLNSEGIYSGGKMDFNLRGHTSGEGAFTTFTVFCYVCEYLRVSMETKTKFYYLYGFTNLGVEKGSDSSVYELYHLVG